MPVIFPRALDGHVRQAGIGVAVAVALAVVGWYYYALPSYTRVGYRPEQPVPFSHELHAGHLGLDCAYCHQSVFESPHASVPTTQVCMNCHNPKKANVKGNSPLLAPVRESYDTGAPVAWKRVHKLPEYAYFNHAVHVNKGVSCVSCHGPVNEMKVVWHDQPLSMGWCLRCHADPHEHLRPVGQVTNLRWKPPAGRTAGEIGTGIQKELAVAPPLGCQACHR
ncbi:MAG: cytochrome c family protein [Gemmataceae bacterium]|nr:cytochrome c family protein [Gemmataceae bacterium]